MRTKTRPQYCPNPIRVGHRLPTVSIRPEELNTVMARSTLQATICNHTERTLTYVSHNPFKAVTRSQSRRANSTGATPQPCSNTTQVVSAMLCCHTPQPQDPQHDDNSTHACYLGHCNARSSTVNLPKHVRPPHFPIPITSHVTASH